MGHVDLAVIVALSLPTGTHRISSHGFDPFIKFPWSKDLARGWSLSGMQSFFWDTGAGGRNLVWEPTLMAEKEISGPWSVFVEYAGDFAQQGSSQSRSPTLALHIGSLQSSRSIFMSVSGSPRRRQSTFLRLATPFGRTA